MKTHAAISGSRVRSSPLCAVSRLLWWARWLPILLPAIALAFLIAEYQVNIPFLDDWMFAPMYEKAARGELTLNDFFVVQMEHRLAVPRLIIVALYYFLPGQFAAQNWITFGLLMVTAFNIGILLWRTGLAFRRWWLPMALASATLFSPILYQVVLWPLLFQVVIPLACLSGALVIIGARWPLGFRWALCVLCAIVPMLSFVSGILVWLLMIPPIVCSEALPRDRRRWIFLGGWLVAAAVVCALYFHDLRNETDPLFSYRAGEGESTTGKGLAKVVSEPIAAATFVIRFVAGPLARGTGAAIMTQALWIGIALTALFCAAALLWLRNWRNVAMRQALLPWLVLGTYAFGTAAMVAIGRMWTTKQGDNALTARYAVHGLALTVALIALATWLWYHYHQEKPSWRQWLDRLAAGGLVFFVCCQTINWIQGVNLMRVWHSSRLRGATNTLFFRLHHQIDIDGQLAGMEPLARRMDDLGLLKPPMLRDSRLDQFRISKKRPLRLSQVPPTLSHVAGKRYRASGVAVLPDGSRVADGVFFTRRDAEGIRRIFHVGQVLELPIYLGRVLSRDLRFVHHRGFPMEQRDLSRFEAELRIEETEPAETEIAIWAFNYPAWTVYPISRFKVDITEGRVRAWPFVNAQSSDMVVDD